MFSPARPTHLSASSVLPSNRANRPVDVHAGSAPTNDISYPLPLFGAALAFAGAAPSSASVVQWPRGRCKHGYRCAERRGARCMAIRLEIAAQRRIPTKFRFSQVEAVPAVFTVDGVPGQRLLARWRSVTHLAASAPSTVEIVPPMNTVRPHRVVAFIGKRKEAKSLANMPRMSAVLLDEAEEIEDALTAHIDADGRRTGPELVLLRMANRHARRSLLSDVTEKVKEQLGGPNGLNGVKAERSIREFYKDRRWLRLVDSDDDPTPAGPAAAQRVA